MRYRPIGRRVDASEARSRPPGPAPTAPVHPGIYKRSLMAPALPPDARLLVLEDLKRPLHHHYRLAARPLNTQEVADSQGVLLISFMLLRRALINLHGPAFDSHHAG